MTTDNSLSRKWKLRIQLLLAVLIPAIVTIMSVIRASVSTSIVVGVLSALILFYLSLMYRDSGDDFDKMVGKIDEVANHVKNQAVIRPIYEANFYDRFLTDVERASHRIEISYFDNKDPRGSSDTKKVEYYQNIGDMAKRKSTNGVEFRRIIRAVPQLEDWVDDILEEHEGTSRYSLACLPDNSPKEPETPHVSIQLIDDNISYLVAVGQQRETSNPRDIFVRSDPMNTQWTEYYEKLWDESYIVLRRGIVQEDELEEYRNHISN